jgi:hypothetical protein
LPFFFCRHSVPPRRAPAPHVDARATISSTFRPPAGPLLLRRILATPPTHWSSPPPRRSVTPQHRTSSLADLQPRRSALSAPRPRTSRSPHPARPAASQPPKYEPAPPPWSPLLARIDRPAFPHGPTPIGVRRWLVGQASPSHLRAAGSARSRLTTDRPLAKSARRESIYVCDIFVCILRKEVWIIFAYPSLHSIICSYQSTGI